MESSAALGSGLGMVIFIDFSMLIVAEHSWPLTESMFGRTDSRLSAALFRGFLRFLKVVLYGRGRARQLLDVGGHM